MTQHISLYDLIEKPQREILDTLLRREREPLQKVAKPLPVQERQSERSARRRHMDTPYDTDEVPDDPNLEEAPLRRAASSDLPAEHESLERDYVFTLDHGLQAGLEDLGHRGFLNPEVDLEAASPPAAPALQKTSIRMGKGKVLTASATEQFVELATEVYRGQAIVDQQGKEWTVLSYNETANEVVLQDAQGFKHETRLHQFLGKEPPPCLYQDGDTVRYFDRQTGTTGEYVVTEVNEASQSLWILVDGKKRRVRFSRVELYNRDAEKPQ